MTITPDQLRWEVTPVLWVAIDGTENVVVEVLGHRTTVTHPAVAIEALRQAQGAQRGDRPDEAILAAEIAKRAGHAQYDAVHQHITRTAERVLADGARFGAVAASVAGELADNIADAALTSMGQLFTESVASSAASVLRELAGDPDWLAVLRMRTLAQMSDHAGQLLEFAHGIAALTDPEPGSEASETLAGVIADARKLLGTPDPDPAAEVVLPHPPISPNGMGPSPGQAGPFGPDAYKSHMAGCVCPDCRAARAGQA